MNKAKKQSAIKKAPSAASKSADRHSTSAEKAFSRVVQTDVPAYPLEKAIAIPRTIADQFARKPVSPLKLASAMNVQPTSPSFRMLTGASIAYGLTKGGWNAKQVEIAPLGLRIVHLTMEGDDLLARREAILKPRVFGSFLTTYDNHPVPRKDIAANVLKDLGVPDDRVERALEMMLESARSVGFITTINGKDYVNLEGAAPPMSEGGQPEAAQNDADLRPDEPPKIQPEYRSQSTSEAPQSGRQAQTLSQATSRVFVTHGKNTQFVELAKKFIRFAKLEPVVAAERQSVAKPVPDKVMDDMRSCGGAIIHVDAEKTLIDQEGKEHVVLNPNVLIEIGAAFALYGRRFILLVKEGVQLPSNLQGLYEVRYTGDILDGNTTMKLLEAIADMQNQALPDRYGTA
jgi:predicted nucleotide-binding protein